MAQIRLMSWNIEVYGPNKYGNVPNRMNLVRFIARAVQQQNANLLVIQELMTSVAHQICFSVAQQLGTYTGHAWQYRDVVTRVAGDRESYGVFWRTDRNFGITQDGNAAENLVLSDNQFPNGFSPWNGRRPVIGVFRTTDTATNFAISSYHAPPRGNQAAQGVEPLATTTMLYSVDRNNHNENVDGRILAGDYNLGVTDDEFDWLTDPLPALPPPNAAGEGAGTTPIVPTDGNGPDYTHYARRGGAVRVWGPNMANWSANPVLYRDYQLDNSYYATPAMIPGAAGGVVDLVAEIMLPASPLRQIAQTFALTDGHGNRAFPLADTIPAPLNVNLSTAPCAWLLYRYGVSDHLPVLNVVTI
jgi:hypothetical protein